MNSNYFRVKAFAQKYPEIISEGALRWLIFNSHKNGMDCALVRLGRRVFIDEDAFLLWLKAGGVK